jgi:hypothetical protein
MYPSRDPNNERYVSDPNYEQQRNQRRSKGK